MKRPMPVDELFTPGETNVRYLHCCACQQRNTSNDFYRNRSSSTGFQTMCKDCTKRRRTTAPPCTEEGCEKSQLAKSLCGAHYKRFQRYGSASATWLEVYTAEVRFWSTVEVGHPAGCWWWTGHISRGYGMFSTGRKSLGEKPRRPLAHRYAYEVLVGPIPAGLHLDHLCKNTLCVNPDHLEPVTPAENNRRSASVSSRNARKTHCIRGHEFDAANTIRTKSGSRACRTCQIRARRAWAQRKSDSRVQAALIESGMGAFEVEARIAAVRR